MTCMLPFGVDVSLYALLVKPFCQQQQQQQGVMFIALTACHPLRRKLPHSMCMLLLAAAERIAVCTDVSMLLPCHHWIGGRWPTLCISCSFVTSITARHILWLTLTIRTCTEGTDPCLSRLSPKHSLKQNSSTSGLAFLLSAVHWWTSSDYPQCLNLTPLQLSL